MTYSIIQKSHLEGTIRLDAEYYKPEYLEKIARLKQFGAVPLEQLAYITDGEHGSPIWDEQSGIKYFSAQHVRDGLLEDTDTKTISRIINDKNKRSQLQEGDILLSTVGTIGFAALVRKNNLPANIDRHVARIVLQPNTLDSEYLVSFLNSSYGRFQSIREATGNVQLNLFIDKIKTLLTPQKNNPLITQQVKNAFDLLENSNILYQKAEQLLLQELGLTAFIERESLYYIVNLSEVKEAKRMDAEYFQPKYERLIEKLKTQNSVSLLDIIENVSARFDPQRFKEKEFKYVELANINGSVGIIDGYNEVLGKEAPSRAKRVLNAGDVIVSSVEGSLEKVALVSVDQEGYLASTGFFQLRSKKLLPEFLLILSKSIVLQQQLQRNCAGTILTAVPNEALKNMLIPVLPIEKQQKIADLVKQSHEARKKSKELLEQAKREVEETIEKG